LIILNLLLECGGSKADYRAPMLEAAAKQHAKAIEFVLSEETQTQWNFLWRYWSNNWSI